jgi:DNA-binding transcriptional MerR regulator
MLTSNEQRILKKNQQYRATQNKYPYFHISIQIIVNKMDEKSLTKAYYTIGEVSEMFDVNASLIRFWHKEFDQIKPKINAKGNRLFTPKDVLTIQRIYQLVKVEGFTLDGAKKSLKQKTVPTAAEVVGTDNTEVIERLESIKSKLIALKGN